jgi:hypothetical protein
LVDLTDLTTCHLNDTVASLHHVTVMCDDHYSAWYLVEELGNN